MKGKPMKSLDSTSPYMAAVRGEKPKRRPIWIMRQAGRYLPEYLAVREKHPFVEVCNTPELACEVTLQPIRRFGFDAAILFSDILVPLAPMGAPFYFGDGSPRLEKPLRDEKEIGALRTVDSRDELAFVGQAIRLITKELGDTPLIGFAGAPFTLAAYLVEGGGSQNYLNLKTMLYKRPDLLSDLLDKLADQVADYLCMQIDAGVKAVQLFDTWAGILTPADYEQYVLPGYQKIFERIGPTGVPKIFFMKNGAPYLELMTRSGADVIGLDWTNDLAASLPRIGGRPVQGNLDPTVLFGTHEEIRRRALAICKAGDAAPGHVFNLGHGILPSTPIEAVEVLVETVKGYKTGGRA
jgi:uroporphyrinogen decarboxylase